MSDAYDVLHAPFDFKTHNETFVNYCEVVIDEDGTIIYGVPSHTECLKRMYTERFGGNPDDDCPKEFYGDYLGWLADKLNACVVYTRMFGRFYNDKQLRQLRKLQQHGCCHFKPGFVRLLGKHNLGQP